MLIRILWNPSLPFSRRAVRLVRYLHKKILGWLTLKARYKLAKKRGFRVDCIPSRGEISEYQKYWGDFGLFIETETIKKCTSISGGFSKGIIPEDIFSADIEPSLNPIVDSTFLQNKSVYSKWFDSGAFPNAYFHKINGQFYDPDLKPIGSWESFLRSGNVPEQGVLKESYASSGGAGVKFISSIHELEKVVGFKKNLVFQELIHQHRSLNEVYSESLNTVRACLYRSVIDGSLHVLNLSLRMGKDGSLDNETAGGIVCSISSEGALNAFAVDKYGHKFFEHPNSGYCFKNFFLPDFEQCNACALRVFSELPHSSIASLDLCYDDKGKWRVIEVNLEDQTIRFAQYAGKPFFGPFTDEVRAWVLKNHWAFRR